MDLAPISTASEPHAPHKMCVLIVDDDAHALRTAVRCAERFGFEVRTATVAEEGLAAIRAQRPDVLLTDLHMPGMGGHNLVRVIRDEDPTLPIVVMSGVGEMDDVIELLRQRIADYVPKPFRPSELAQALRRATAEPAAQAGPGSAAAAHAGDDPLADFTLKGLDFGSAGTTLETVTRLMQQGSASGDRVVQWVSSSPVLTRHVLAMANTAFYRGQRSVTNLHEAAVRLGNRAIVSAAQTVAAKGLFVAQDPALQAVLDEAWRSAVLVARLTRELARYRRTGDPEDAYLAALMCPIGQVAMLRYLDQQSAPYSLDAARAAIGSRYPAATLQLLRGWGMPALCSAVAERHLQPGGSVTGPRPAWVVAHLVRISLWAVEEVGRELPVPLQSAPVEISFEAARLRPDDVLPFARQLL